MKSMITDQERGEMIEMAGIAGSQIAGHMTSVVMEFMDRQDYLTQDQRDATLTLIGVGIADHVDWELPDGS